MVMFIPKKGLSATEHESIDHSEIPGCGEEAFDEAAHALVDHSTQLGVPSIAGLLDETAHDALDHTGLTGIPDEFDWDMDAATPHRLVDHSGIPGVATEEAFDAAAHALTDHSTQLGVPSIAGLLDETAHDALDHTGLPGVGGLVATFGNTSISEASVGGSLYNGGSFLCRGKFTLSESADVSKLSIYLDNQGDGHAACNVRVGIYDDDGASGKAATLKGSKEVSITDNMVAQHVDFTFASVVSLAAGDWWLAVEGDSNAGGCRVYVQTTGGTFHVSAEDYLSDLPDPPTDPFHTDSKLMCAYATYTVPAYFVDPVAAEANLPSSDNNDGDLIVVKDSHKIYIWDAEANTPCWRETNREITHENVTVDASSWRNFQISLIDRSMLNILDFECIISKIAITAIDGNATPALDYNIELFTDSSRTVYAYWAQNIDTVLFEDKIPFLWEGGSTVYGRIVNNKAAAITDLDITIKFRV